MSDIAVMRCCMCPNIQVASQECPGIPGTPHPIADKCRFVRKWKDSRGWKYQVMGGISAKDKERQIKVLSDLNCVSPREIADILDEAGELKKVGLNAKTFSSVYHAVPAAKSPQREEPKTTRKRSGSVPPLDEIRAMELFNDGMDDLAISEALGVSVTRIKKVALAYAPAASARRRRKTKTEQGGANEKEEDSSQCSRGT